MSRSAPSWNPSRPILATLIVYAIVAASLVAFTGCTRMTILAPECVVEEHNWQTGEVRTFVMEHPDSTCVRRFLEETARR